MQVSSFHRRHFLKLIAAAGAAASGLVSAVVQAAEKLALSDPTAVALGYVEDASKIDAAKEAAHKKGAACAGCALFGAAQGGYGPCGAFGGKLVSAKGWCRAFAAKS